MKADILERLLRGDPSRSLCNCPPTDGCQQLWPVVDIATPRGELPSPKAAEQAQVALRALERLRAGKGRARSRSGRRAGDRASRFVCLRRRSISFSRSSGKWRTATR